MAINSEIRMTPETFAAEIVAAYVSNNPVPAAELPGLIDTVRAALAALGAPVEAVPEPEPLTPAVSIKKSVTQDHIICLECGKSFKSLKRHLLTHHGLSPDEYRQRWSLQASYPMVAPNYADARSQLALSMGLGRKRGMEATEAVEEAPPAPEPAPEPEVIEAAPAAAAPAEVAETPAEEKPAPKRRGRKKADAAS